ncbi:MAG TPA: PPE family protein [Mycobacterium sp.]|uniref:PPE family protein n=1 Tax=Mycobacterium sp. TaxID=1785 RepID=UPI002F3EAF01
MTAPIWMASPPEVHSALLISGPGPGSLLVAAEAWNALSAEYALAADELTAVLTSVQAGGWEGPSAESYAAAHVPYLAWLMQASADSTAAAARQETAAAAYTAALAAMPTLAELAANHAIHGVLLATNFFGINAIPIALNEADYVRMWVQAATTMTSYQAVSAAAVASSPQTQPAPAVVNSAASGYGNTVTNAIAAIEQLLHDASTLNLSDLQSSLLNVVQNFNVTAFLQNPVGYSQQIVESFVNNFPVLSDLYYGFGGDHIFELLTDPVGFVQHIISNFLANPLGVLENPFTLLLSADDYPTIFYPLISPAIAPAFAIASVGSAGGLAGLAAIPPTTMPVVSPVLAPATLAVPALGMTPTVVVSAVAPAAAPASAPAPASPPAPAATATVASPAPALPPPGAPFVPPYAVGPPGIGFDSGMSASAASRAKRKAPEPDSAAAVAAAAVRGQRQARRRRRAILRDHGDEFADMNIEVNPDWDAPPDDEPLASSNGAGPLGFAGTVRNQAIGRAAGLATLAGDGFGGGPTVPMLPVSWDSDANQQ